MTDKNTQGRLEKLDRMEAKARERSRRYLEKAKEQGKKQLSAIISGKAYDQLCRIRDAAQLAGKPESFGQIIEKALACYADDSKPVDETTNINSDVDTNQNHNTNTNVNSDISISDTVNQGIEQTKASIRETQTEIPGPMPDRITDKVGYRDWLFNHLDGLIRQGMSWIDISTRLNADGIKTINGKEWGERAAYQFFQRELKRKS